MNTIRRITSHLIIPVLALILFGVGQVWGDDQTGRVSKGDLLKQHQYETFANYALFVDPTGSDSNACTSSGANACLTIQGAIKKIPKQARHQATVSVAAGNYAGITISGFMFDQSLQNGAAGILIDGALANVTPTTGSATGTATAGSAGSGITFGTLTDSGATWTVNDAALIGKFVVITGGTGSGQVKVIVSNTATALTIAGTWTAPTGTSTYALQSPSVNITSGAPAVVNPLATSVPTAGAQIFNNVANVGRIAFRNVNFAPGGSIVGASVFNSGIVDFVQATFVTTSGLGLNIQPYNAINLTTCSVVSTTGTGIGLATSTVAVTNSLIQQSTGISVLNTGEGLLNLSGVQLKGSVGITSQTGSSASIGNVRCDCASQATSACLVSGPTPSVALGAAGGGNRVNSTFLSQNVDVTNCTYALFASGTSAINVAGAVVVSGNALTYSANALWGAGISASTSVQTITSGTADMAVDNGVSTGTWASLAASFNCLTSLSTTSHICRL